MKMDWGWDKVEPPKDALTPGDALGRAMSMPILSSRRYPAMPGAVIKAMNPQGDIRKALRKLTSKHTLAMRAEYLDDDKPTTERKRLSTSKLDFDRKMR